MTAVAVKEYIGSTSSFYEIEEGMILKSLHPVLAEREGYKVIVEMKILERLGEHPSIVKYNNSNTTTTRSVLFLTNTQVQRLSRRFRPQRTTIP